MLFFLTLSVKLIADLDGYFYNESDTGITFSVTSVEIDSNLRRPVYLPSGTFLYSQFVAHQIPFINLTTNGVSTYLVLYNSPILLLYEKESNDHLELWGSFSRVLYPEGFNYFTSSEYRQGDEFYPAGNLRSRELAKPWVEGVDGPGINEWIEIKGVRSQYGDTPKIGGLVFSNGFVSFDKPFLFQDNNRVKELMITEHDGSKPYIVQLFDSPNPQVIRFSEPYDTVRLTIVDVYHGRKWDDTCINFLLPIEEW